jgi:L-amino acid N-acyltransferase YncA
LVLAPRRDTADGVSASPVSGVRRATPDDAAGVAAVLNGVIAGGRHSLLDTPFTVDEERAYIETLPARSCLHVVEAEGGIIAFQTVIPWNTFVTHEHDHVATMGTYVDARHRRRGVGGALAAASFRAARELGYEKIFTDLRADNLDSLDYHLAMGFSIVGAARRHARVAGRDVDVIFIERFLEG